MDKFKILLIKIAIYFHLWQKLSSRSSRPFTENIQLFKIRLFLIFLWVIFLLWFPAESEIRLGPNPKHLFG